MALLGPLEGHGRRCLTCKKGCHPYFDEAWPQPGFAAPVVDRDCGKETLEAFLGQLLPHLDSQVERTEADEAIKKWNESAGVSLFVPQIPPLPLVGPDGGDPLPAARRVSCCDVMLTFNNDFVPRGTWLCPPGRKYR